MAASTEVAGLVPIDKVARRFGLRASTIRYYEECGLLDASARHAGRRWYGPAELRRLAIIRYWQESGLMRLADIGEMLSGSDDRGRWRAMIDEQLRTLSSQIERMTAAKEFLEHVVSHHDAAPDGCPHYEALIWDRIGQSPADEERRPPFAPREVSSPPPGPR